MKTIQLRPADPERDFGQIAALFNTYNNDQTTTEAGLKEDYAKDKERIIQQGAFDEKGELLGFYWASQSRLEEGRVYADLIVKEEYRHLGVGSFLYADMERTIAATPAKKLRLTVLDTHPEYKAFAEKRGYAERLHLIGMELNLDAFDARPYDELIAKLKSQGFQFTTMEELGNTEEAQYKLYNLNDTAAAETAGGMGEHPWASFEDFQKKVCQSDWYMPSGQMVVIDSATGNWAAMSAITRYQGADYAYNLFTGVEWHYRGRMLAQAVKAQALRYARDILKVHIVRTHHNTLNLPMIHIDRKFGYTVLPGTFVVEKVL